MSGDLYLSECFMSDGGVLLPALHEGSSLFDFWQQWRRQQLPTEHKLSSQDVTLLQSLVFLFCPSEYSVKINFCLKVFASTDC